MVALEEPRSLSGHVGVEVTPAVVPQSRGLSLRRRLVVSDAAVVALSWCSAHLLSSEGGSGVVTGLLLLTVVTVATLLMLQAQHLYRSRVAAVRADEVARLARVALASTVVAVASSSLLGFRDFTWTMVSGGVILFVSLAYTRGRYDAWIRARRSEGCYTRPVVLLGDNDEAAELAGLLDESPELGFRAVGYVGRPPGAGRVELPWLGGVDEIADVAAATGATGVLVVCSCVPEGQLRRVIRDLHARDVHVHLSSGITGLHRRRLRVMPLAHEPLLYVEPLVLSGCQLAAKRVLDVVVASIGLVVTAPVLLASAIAIKRCDGGPVLFRQERVGQNGAPFTVLKLRTMSVDAEQKLIYLGDRNLRDGPLFKLNDDPRVTRVGRWLRDTSIDELPQLLNVLRGDMSLVGPRPALASEVAQFDAELLDRLTVKPGISGLWQVEARDKASFSAYRRLDLFYVENWSLSLDLAVLCATGRAVVGRGCRAVRDRWQRREPREAQLAITHED